jgi:hypothetical protein
VYFVLKPEFDFYFASIRVHSRLSSLICYLAAATIESHL